MEHSLKMLDIAFGAILLLIAIGVLFGNVRKTNKLIASVEHTVRETNVILESADNDSLSADEIISYDELCCLLAAPLDYDVTVVSGANTKVFSKDSYNYLLIDFNVIPRAAHYKRIYLYDSGNGKIKSLLFKAVTT